ncbi:Bug family tripartite tricarboxylate transporter substrate binding protein [Mesorhizobium sp. L-8-10]|uniref:Bug family tripartite tricarboxylate transporter substrate binding protein n=1 Tax=Mesorhizobium sp. L-8-10 TaxID=2744523 RepID=UPI001FD160E9|nr:tripartite tricarboxylate transporter substrate binding protein [Mesorhizobium sp. L-8-10]
MPAGLLAPSVRSFFCASALFGIPNSLFGMPKDFISAIFFQEFIAWYAKIDNHDAAKSKRGPVSLPDIGKTSSSAKPAFQMENDMRIPSILGALGLGLALGAAALSAPAAAQDFPSGPITLVVNWPAGGGMDRAGRLVAEYAKKHVNVPIAVINVDGAGGATGVRHVADAKPDGYTIGILGASIISSQYVNQNANAIDDIDYLAFFGPDPAALEVRSDLGVNSVDEFIAKLKEASGSVKNGNDAPGGVSHIAAALLEAETGVKLSKVPYQGYAPTVAAILSGEVNSATLPVHQLIDQHKSGEVKILGVMSTERHFMAPDVPTFQELGVDLVAGDWRALYVPKGIPEEHKAALEKMLADTTNDPEFQDAAKKMGFVITPMDAAETTEFVKKSDAELYPILVEAGLVKVREK